MTQEQDNPDNEGIQDDEQNIINGSQAKIVDPDSYDEDGQLNGEDNSTSGEESGESERKYAGVFKSVEDLEAGYKELQGEFTRNRQADSKGKSTDSQDTDNNNQQQSSSDIDQLRDEVADVKLERDWGKLEAQYGDDIRAKVKAHFDTLPPEDQEQLNTIAGARLIAKMLSSGSSSKQRSGKQQTGAPQKHRKSASKLTRAQINQMPPDEYARRQGEIQRFYAGLHSQ